MTSPKYTQLQLIHHDHPHENWYLFEGDTCFYEIVAPYVEHLTIFWDFIHTKIKIGEFSSLNHANLDLYCDEFDEMDENILKDLLVSVRCVNDLILSSWLIEVSYQSQMSPVISILMLEEECSCISKFSFSLLDNLLRSIRNLQNLMIFPDLPCVNQQVVMTHDMGVFAKSHDTKVIISGLSPTIYSL
ncbi:hypothetical protein H5410_005587 [Solanum commersonii]|uniref:Uncharacterized protein n=1 Tax=Solanum commersonii TaxID=4109 RepID=A0A9J6A764_SOLCO|nr:hypothetical protein H5410_005587 [Solanum commersonii]